MPLPEDVIGGPAQLTWYIGQDDKLYAHELQTDCLFALSETSEAVSPGPPGPQGPQGPPGPAGPPGITEAPADDQTYGRQNSDWTSIPAIPTAGVVIHTIQPVSAAEGTSVPITVNGTGFTATSVVNWGGFPLATTFISDTVLEATLNLGPGSSGIYTVWVTDGTLLSNSVAFTVSIDGTTFTKSGGPSCLLNINVDGDLILTQKIGPNAGKTVNLTYGKWA